MPDLNNSTCLRQSELTCIACNVAVLERIKNRLAVYYGATRYVDQEGALLHAPQPLVIKQAAPVQRHI